MCIYWGGLTSHQSLKHPWFGNYVYALERNLKTRFKECKLIFVKGFIQVFQNQENYVQPVTIVNLFHTCADEN